MEPYTDSPVANILEPPPTSASSSLSSSWQDILTGQVQLSPSVSTSVSTLTQDRSPSVKFAPLPKLARRKRRSAVPLGVAARAQLVRRPHHYQPGDYLSTYPGDAGPGSARRGVPDGGTGRTYSEPEDSFTALGKVVRGVWRRVAKKGEDDIHGVAGRSGNIRGRIGDYGEMDVEEEMEEVEEVEEVEVTVKFREDISQTETVRDNSAYSWSRVVRPIGNDSESEAGLGG